MSNVIFDGETIAAIPAPTPKVEDTSKAFNVIRFSYDSLRMSPPRTQDEHDAAIELYRKRAANNQDIWTGKQR